MAARPACVLVVTLDGEIGNGKTKLLEALRAHLPYATEVAHEPIEQWMTTPLFAAMYQAVKARAEWLAAVEEHNARQEPPPPEPANHGLPALFQVYAFTTRIAEFAKAYDRAEQLSVAAGGAPVVLFSERSPHTDRLVFAHMLRAAGHISDVQMCAYEGCFTGWQVLARRTQPDLALYVDTPLEESLARIRRRARPDEHVDEDYQRALRERHTQLFQRDGHFLGAPVVMIDGLEPYHEDPEAAKRVAAQTAAAIARQLAARGAQITSAV